MAYNLAKPVIGSKVGGIEEVIDEGKTGFLVEPENEVDLAECIVKAFSEPQNLISIGKNGKNLNDERYSWGRIAIDTKQVYEKVL